MNYNNLSQRTNFIAGSSKLDLLPFYLTNVNIPGINFSYPEFGGRQGVRIHGGGDGVTFNNLSFEMLVDEKFNIYNQFMDIITQSINYDDGTFADNIFDFWVQINDNKGNKVLKFDFFDCRIESIGDINLDTQDDVPQYSLSVELIFDYYLRS
jgi:hypothetical protein